MSEGDQLRRIADEEMETNNSGGENAEMNYPENQNKRKRYHRHMPEQIQAMEQFFRDCPHPDTKQRNELSQELGMDPIQVKFWFQNKRTQMKTKHDRQENAYLRVENENLKAENMRYREVLGNASCPACGRMASIGDVSLDDRHLRMENARLREEIERISAAASRYVGKPLTNLAVAPSASVPRSTSLGCGPFFKGSTSKAKGSNDEEDSDDEPKTAP
ncbi:hypothetical protein DH2020_025506 [Rehmannia glutinosa]|uniref:Homeobox domain-containing protein n=1 Tax=Rehmannia glutinosa TaxID=99300 RepID=A0ABR0VZI5_REHGL